jgi:hypothetical protein
MKRGSRASSLLQSGLIFATASFLAGLGNYAFQGIIGRQLGQASGEYGLVLTTLSFTQLLGLPLAIAAAAVTHYIARFNFSGDDARLHGLLTGCRRFLFHLTVAGSVLAVILVKPLSDFFHFPRTGLMLVALVCVLAGLWSSFVTAFCQGLAWFKRLALIGLLAVILRILSGWLATRIWHVAELAVLASAVMLLANLVLLFWKKDFPRRTDTAISPWTGEFIQFLVVSAASVFGTYCLTQGDLLVAQRNNFPGASLSAYSAAGLLARALPMVVAPLLTVLFTHRSSQHHGDALQEQLKLLGLYAAGLIGGAIALFILRDFCVQLIFGKPAPEAAAMIGRFAPAMVFVGLLQALGMWSLASRWIKLALFYGALGLAYWLTLLALGKTPAALLQTMPVAAGAAFGMLFIVWLVAMRRHKPVVQS